MEDWKLNKTLSGVPQGSILSPILSNILLSKLDRFVETELIPEYTRGKKKKPNQEYNRLMNRARKRYNKGQKEAAHKIKQQAQKLPSIDPQDPDFRRLRYIKYADDVRHLTHNEILLTEKEGSEENDLRVISPT